ncbi:MAG: DUF3619 family protein [Betaproteobacteria bacterium]|nr:DUF3619 family protein [Betaproteobacteria bacterium]
MNQPDEDLARRVVQHLDYGADHLDQRTRERLLDARKTALSYYRERGEPVRGLAWAGNLVTRRFEHSVHGARYLVGGAALIAALLGIVYWQNASGPASQLAEIDAGLLSDELPINAYLDKGFDSWLKRSLR